MNRSFAVFSLLLFLLPTEAEGLDAPGGRWDILAFFHGGGGGEKSLLKAKERALVQRELAGLDGTANLVLFTEEKGCDACGEVRRFVEEMAALSPNVSCEILPLTVDDGRAAELGIDKAPGIAVFGAADSGIRYYGLPLGYEFEEFVKAVRQVMESKPRLAPETVLALSRLSRPVILTVFIVDT